MKMAFKNLEKYFIILIIISMSESCVFRDYYKNNNNEKCINLAMPISNIFGYEHIIYKIREEQLP
jgi:hypothetical protein